MKVVLERRLMVKAAVASGLSLMGLRSRACEFFSPNLRVTHPWTRATPDGVNSCVVCMRFDQVLLDDRLIGLQTPIAGGAEMGGPGAQSRIDVPIPMGQETLLSETGTHIRLVELTQPMEIGRAYPIQLFFEQGGLLRANLSVDYQRFL